MSGHLQDIRRSPILKTSFYNASSAVPAIKNTSPEDRSPTITPRSTEDPRPRREGTRMQAHKGASFAERVSRTRNLSHSTCETNMLQQPANNEQPKHLTLSRGPCGRMVNTGYSSRPSQDLASRTCWLKDGKAGSQPQKNLSERQSKL